MDEAYLTGQAAVRAAIDGKTDKMVTLTRAESDAYVCETGLADLSEIANGVKPLPASWINENGTSLTYQFVKYASPLIQGEVVIPHENGLPKFIRLGGTVVDKVLPPYDLNG